MGECKKILIIDKDETALINLSMFFAENDFYVIYANNVTEGIQKTLTEKPCLIILGMSGKSNIIVTRKLQINKNIKRIPIIMIGDVPLFKKHFGLNEQFPMLKNYIIKPINRELLFKKVNELLNHKFR